MNVVRHRPRTTGEPTRRAAVRVRAVRDREAGARAAAAHLASADALGAARAVPSLRWTIGALGLALVLVAAVVGSRLAGDPVRFPVTHVDVLGTLDYTDRDALRARIADELERGFHGLDVDVVRREVEDLPWVERARVSRIWPARVSIEVEEHEPAARWNDDALLSKRLALFRPPQLSLEDPRHAEWREVFAELPRLSGADGRHADVLEDHRRYAAELAPLGLRLEALLEDARRSQTLELSDAVTVRLGYEERALRLARFVDVHERLVAPLEGRPARFDMRYSNGFAFRGAEGTSALGGESVDAPLRTGRVGDDVTTVREPG